METVDIVDLLAVIFDVCLIQYFLSVFFPDKFIAKKFRIPLIVAGTVIYYCSSIYVESAYWRMAIYLLLCLFFSFCVHGSIFKKIPLIFLYAIIGIMIESITAAILVSVENNFYKVNRTDYTDQYIAGVFLCNTLIFLVMLSLNFVRKKFCTKSSSPLESTKYLLFIVFVIVFIGMFCGIRYLVWTSDSISSVQIFLVLLLMMVALAIILFFTLTEMEHLQAIKLENALINERLAAQERFYKESIQKNEQLHHQIHDEKNFLLALKGFLENNENKQGMKMVNDRIGSISSDITAFSGDIALDTLLSIKINEAQKANISIKPTIAVLGKLFISSLDLCLILGNALDNAIEACKKLGGTNEKIIKLEIRTVQDYLAVSTINPYDKVAASKDYDKLITTKKDALNHGYGLKSINHLAQKYNGTCKITAEKGIFTLDILLLNQAKI